MNPAFENINQEKKQKIITACLEEFTARGYENASTNIMVKKAEISKGLLFHYFGSKKNIYIYLLDLSIEYFTSKYNSYNAKPSDDIFERIMQGGLIKLKIASEQPLMYKLVMEAFIDIPKELEGAVNTRYNKIYAENMPLLLQNVDYSPFRDDLDKKRAIEFIMLCFDALYNKYLKMFKGKALALTDEDMTNMVEEYNSYFDMIKFGMYKRREKL